MANRHFRPISPDGRVRLPDNSGGVTAYKFRDHDGHPLELLEFPQGRIPSQRPRQRQSARAESARATIGTTELPRGHPPTHLARNLRRRHTERWGSPRSLAAAATAPARPPRHTPGRLGGHGPARRHPSRRCLRTRRASLPDRRAGGPRVTPRSRRAPVDSAPARRRRSGARHAGGDRVRWAPTLTPPQWRPGFQHARSPAGRRRSVTLIWALRLPRGGATRGRSLRMCRSSRCLLVNREIPRIFFDAYQL